ncbi:MAG: hypothetical protein WKF58_06985 [Ilumatobacteraceae bacterium]
MSSAHALGSGSVMLGAFVGSMVGSVAGPTSSPSRPTTTIAPATTERNDGRSSNGRHPPTSVRLRPFGRSTERRCVEIPHWRRAIDDSGDESTDALVEVGSVGISHRAHSGVVVGHGRAAADGSLADAEQISDLRCGQIVPVRQVHDRPLLGLSTMSAVRRRPTMAGHRG